MQERWLLGSLGKKTHTHVHARENPYMQVVRLGGTFLPARPPDCWTSAGVANKGVPIITPSGLRMN